MCNKRNCSPSSSVISRMKSRSWDLLLPVGRLLCWHPMDSSSLSRANSNRSSADGKLRFLLVFSALLAQEVALSLCSRVEILLQWDLIHLRGHMSKEINNKWPLCPGAPSLGVTRTNRNQSLKTVPWTKNFQWGCSEIIFPRFAPVLSVGPSISDVLWKTHRTQLYDMI